MDTGTVNHRRDRQHTRRILAEIVVRGRDLTGSFFRTELDLLDGACREPANDNDRDAVAVSAKGTADACR
jgi:hypothetical protein